MYREADDGVNLGGWNPVAGIVCQHGGKLTGKPAMACLRRLRPATV